MEIWKSIKDYPNYEVSNLGRVKSFYFGRVKLLTACLNNNGYLHVRLAENKISKTKLIHQLVARAFLNHKPCGFELVINHINLNKLDNRIENLEIVTARENLNQKHRKSSSKYTGVSWSKTSNKWLAYIHINGKQKHLGYFISEIEASNAYQNELKQIIP